MCVCVILAVQIDSAWLCFSFFVLYFCAQGVKTRADEEDLGGARVRRQVVEAMTTVTRSGRRMATEHSAAMLRARKSTMTYVVCTYHLLSLLFRLLFSFFSIFTASPLPSSTKIM